MRGREKERVRMVGEVKVEGKAKEERKVKLENKMWGVWREKTSTSRL
jgi:hypothetical protein